MEESYTEGIYDTDIYFLTEILEESISYTMKSENSFYNNDEKPRRPHFLFFDPEWAFDRICRELNKYDSQRQLSLYKNLFNLIEDKQVEYLGELDLNSIPKHLRGELTVNIMTEKMDSLRGYVKNYINGLINEINSHTELQVTVNEDEKASESIPQEEQSQIEKEKSLLPTNSNVSITNISAGNEEGMIDNKSVNIINEKVGKSSKSKKFDRFIWHRTRESLVCLFEYLLENNKITDYSEDSLYKHFIIESENNKVSSDNFKKINWLSDLTELAYIIEHLLNKNYISKQGRGIHVLTIKHFTFLGEIIKKGSITTSISTVRAMEPLPHNYIELKDIIDKLPI